AKANSGTSSTTATAAIRSPASHLPTLHRRCVRHSRSVCRSSLATTESSTRGSDQRRELTARLAAERSAEVLRSRIGFVPWRCNGERRLQRTTFEGHPLDRLLCDRPRAPRPSSSIASARIPAFGLYHWWAGNRFEQEMRDNATKSRALRHSNHCRYITL